MKKTALFLMGTAALAFLAGILLLGETSKTLSYIDAYSTDFSFLNPHSNLAAVLGASTAGLVGYWKFDEGGGATAADSSGNGATGTLNSGVSWADGKVGKALSFDSGTGTVYLPTTLPSGFNFGTGSFSVSTWLKPSSFSQAYPRPFEIAYCSASPSYISGEVAHSITNSTFFSFAVVDSNNKTRYINTANDAISLSQWVLITVVVDRQGGTGRIYVNGVQSGDTSDITNLTGNVNCSNATIAATIGSFNGGLNYQGLMDDLRIYNRALSATEITDIYNDTGAPPSSDTQAPSVPTSLTTTAISSSQTNLSWSASTDNVGVAGYRVFRNSTQVGTPTGTSYSDTGLTASTQYSYTVKALDAAGNLSVVSNTANATTQAAPPAGPVTYYVDFSGGNDSNSGTSLSAPWKTIARINSSVFQAGNHILFKRGEVWREQLTISSSGTASSPIVFDAYGTGATPVISGANIVSGWTQYSGNIYVANVGGITTPTQLYVDGAFYDIAHYPNSGYLSATSNSSDTTSIIDSNLTLPANQILGATVITKAVPWALSTTLATAYNAAAHKITLNDNVYGTQQMQTNFGFYLQNMLWMLDAPGEWYYDASAGKLYLWTTGNDNPSSHTIEVSNRSSGIQVSGKNYVTIQNIAVTSANQYEVSVLNASNVTLSNLNLSGGQTGIYANYIASSAVQNNSIQNTLSDGIRFDWGTNSNSSISNNTITNAGNTGASPKESVGGIYTNGTNITIASNTITNSGYIGIAFYGSQNLIQNNVIDRACLVLDDCGGIYTWGSSSFSHTISGNTITNAIGNASGTPHTSVWAVGIYLDDLSHDISVFNNNISNTETGIFIHTGHNNTVTGNMVYRSRSYGFLINKNTAGALPGSVHDNLVTNNTFETSSAQATASYYDIIGADKPYLFGTFNNNRYFHPNANYVISSQFVNYTLSTWQQLSGQDLNSTDTNSYCGGITSDITPPSIPSGLSSSAISSTQINLSWSASSDNVGVTGYKVYRGGTQIATVTSGTSYQNIGLSPSTTYSYTVSAYDAAGNTSAQSSSASATTQAPIVGDFNHDGLVNSIDFSLMTTAWNQNNPTYDLNHDTIINSMDYVIMVQNWSQ